MFTMISVLCSLIGIIMTVSFLIGLLIGWLNGDLDMSWFIGWILSSAGFGVSLTLFLAEKGVLS